MTDFSLALPDEICAELGARTRTRRVLLNISAEELAKRVGITSKTLGNFERTGRCNLETFVSILDALNATGDLQTVLVTQTRSIEEMRTKASVATRQRAYRKTSKPVKASE
jgi:transcriptional regulator with XRE-family HTH domain